jgi:hypothetical protein
VAGRLVLKQDKDMVLMASISWVVQYYRNSGNADLTFPVFTAIVSVTKGVVTVSGMPRL